MAASQGTSAAPEAGRSEIQTLLWELPEGAQLSKAVYRHLASRTVRGNVSVVLSHQEFGAICCSKYKKRVHLPSLDSTHSQVPSRGPQVAMCLSLIS